MKYIVPILLLLLAASCNTPQEPPKFRKISNVRVTNVTGKEALLKGDAVFYNPNDVGMTLRKVDIAVSLDDKRIGTINHATKTKVPAMSDFSVPVDATFNISDGLLNNLFSMLGGKKMKARYKGYIKLTVKGVPIRVPVDYEEEIRLR
ncbi:LEA type 2 family protein [Fulvivirga lutea]|uniref:LEA type 2 family protein n=1 Tax=Fulvivirga lutea TaxID=2810512 RepID=A0A974WH49_9BACT|nr:LEA type 2 family protein [Fulvivirga lutea]QSE97995.1 LEA type 2 family protein [Fulvivirga lutea]